MHGIWDGLTAGMQCTCNVLNSVTFTLEKCQVTENSDAIYKSLNIVGYVAMDKLPHEFIPFGLEKKKDNFSTLRTT